MNKRSVTESGDLVNTDWLKPAFCSAFDRNPTTHQGVTKRAPTPTRSSPTIITCTPTTIAPGTTGYLRTSLAKTKHCFLSWWQQKIRPVCGEIRIRAPCIPGIPLLSPVKSYGQSQTPNLRCYQATWTVRRHKLDFSFLISVWTERTSTFAFFHFGHLETTRPVFFFPTFVFF